ncbi:MAG TPA: beta-ketoacyl synthase chain length factor [Burkholderiales bacterium]|nr:beta-ketoacyl synthase chain length factor [Burkholderiales bacterium]
MLKFFVEAVGVLGPGLAGWEAARPILAGVARYVPADLVLPRFETLPAAERRRIGLVVKLSIAVGLQALEQAGKQGDAVPTVFTSSGGDGDVINEICAMLAGSDRLISPTRFHNSVHNASSGYWGIATGSRAPSTSLCAFDWSFAAGLTEAATQVNIDHESVLLIAYDLPYPEPLRSARPIGHPFASALLITREHTPRSAAACEIASGGAGAPSRMRDGKLEQLRRDNPAARSLPLLAALAGARGAGQTGVFIENTAGNTLGLSVTPC